MGLMTLVSVTQGRRLFFLCRRLGLLPAPGLSAAAESRTPVDGKAATQTRRRVLKTSPQRPCQ